MVPPTQKRSGWSDLQPELMELVLQKLVLGDYLKCRGVCRQWRSTVNGLLETKKRCPPAPQFPSLLLLPHSLHKKDPATLFDLSRNKLQHIPTHGWESYSELLQSEEGWLLFQGMDCYNPSCNIFSNLFWIFNPVSGEKYNLPLLLWQTDQPCIQMPSTYIRATFSSTPDSQNFLVVICSLLKQESISQLYFCRPTDKSWTRIETNESRSTYFGSIVLLGWKLYAMNGFNSYESYSVTVFNLRDVNAITTERLIMKLPKLNDFGIRELCGLARDSTCGEVLLVLITSDICEIKDIHKIKDIHIFKLDMSASKCIKLDSLSGRALFVDHAGVRVISTAELNGPTEFVKGNCVFFWIKYLLSQDLSIDHGVFFLKDKTIRKFHINSSGIQHRCLWFTPSPW